MKRILGKKLPFRFVRVLAIIPLSGSLSQSELVTLYNEAYRIRILATLSVNRLFGLLMTERRMEQILSAMVRWHYLEVTCLESESRYSLTARGIQARTTKRR